jgi:hypothetical protein
MDANSVGEQLAEIVSAVGGEIGSPSSSMAAWSHSRASGAPFGLALAG